MMLVLFVFIVLVMLNSEGLVLVLIVIMLCCVGGEFIELGLVVVGGSIWMLNL